MMGQLLRPAFPAVQTQDTSMPGCTRADIPDDIMYQPVVFAMSGNIFIGDATYSSPVSAIARAESAIIRREYRAWRHHPATQ